MAIMRLRSRWDETALSEHRAASHMLSGRLKLVSDQRCAEFKPCGTVDITTTSSLAAWSEVNLQRLLRQRLGEPIKNYRIDSALTKLEVDCYHYAILALLVNAIQHAKGLEIASTTAARNVARHVGGAILADLQLSGPPPIDISLILNQWTQTTERSKRIRAIQERLCKLNE